MTSASAPAERRQPGHWRLWALVPLLLLAGVVALFASTGTSLLDLVGRAPPPLDQFNVRRVEFKPGEIRIRVTNPQRPKLTIASVTVDDAIVPYRLDGPAALGRLRSSTIIVPFQWVEDDPYTVGSHQLERNPDDLRHSGGGRNARTEPARLPWLLHHRLPGRRRAGGPRARLAALRSDAPTPVGSPHSWR